jgi:hypothetical protein
MSRHDHPAFVRSRTENRHLRLVPPVESHDDPTGNAVVGAFCAIVVLACFCGLAWLALWWRP